MKKLFATASLYALIHLMAVLSSCCTDTETYCFDFVGLEARNLDNTGMIPTPPTTDTIPAAAYTLGVQYLQNDGTCLETTRFDWNPLSSALATSCAEDFTYLLNDSIVSIDISSLADFDAAHPKGTSLYSYFAGPDARKINQAIRDSGRVRNAQYFLLKNPDAIRPHSFITKITLASGAIFADTTDQVVLSL
jgi:hypothetical protein